MDKKLKVIVCVGDTHGEIWKINDCVEDAKKLGYDVAGAIQVGDFGFYDMPVWQKYEQGKSKFLVQTLVIHGNHEAPKVYRRAISANIHNLKVAKPIEFINMFGLSILCVGGARSVDKIGEETHIIHDDAVYHDAITEWFKLNKPKIDLIVTHEAPNKIGLKPNERIQQMFNVTTELGCQELRDLVAEVKPRFQINGHHHSWNRGFIGESECWTLPIPFCQNPFWGSRTGYGMIILGENMRFLEVMHLV